MQRAVLNNGAKSYMEFFRGSQPKNTDATPTVSVERNGVALAAPTVVVENSFGQGFYSVVLTPTDHTNELGVLDILWSAEMDGLAVTKTMRLEIVGARYFDIGELRKLTGMENPNTHSDIALWTALSEAEATVEDYTKYSFTDRAGQDVFDACDYSYEYGIHVRRRPVTRLVGITIDDAALDITDWSINRQGRVREKSGYGANALTHSYGVDNLVIDYVYGDYLEADLKRATLLLARHYVLGNTSAIPDRSRLMQTEFGLFVLDAPGQHKATGLPEVDGTLNRYCEVSPGSFA